MKKGATEPVTPLSIPAMNAALVLPSRHTDPQKTEAKEQ
jgi:hypothetical protein